MKIKNCFLFLLLLGSFHSKAQQLDHVLGDLIIQLSPKLEDPTTVLSRHAHVNGKTAKWKVKKRLNQELNIWLVQFDFTEVNEFRIVDILRSDPFINKAQFNHLLDSRSIPDDPLFPQQWNWLNTGANGGIADADIDADEAWDITTGGLTAQGDTIVIAVLDEGIDLDHIDLQANLWKNHREIPNNGVDDDGNGFVDDFHGWNVNTDTDVLDHDLINGTGHGTEVAGLIGALGNNQLLATGINWKIKLMILAPYGNGNVVTEALAIEGYNYVLVMRKRYNETNGREGAFVVATNSSWGIDNQFPEDTPIWCAFYDELGKEGIVNTIATVNGNVNIDAEGDIPTTCTSPFVIGVSNSNNRDRKPNRAGFGEQSIDLFAPGENIPIIRKDDTFAANGSGTSYAAPTVAGVVGLLYAAPCDNFVNVAKQAPASAASLVRNYILEGVDVKSELIGLSTTGGRLNAFNSLQLLLEDCGACPPILGLTVEEQQVEDELTINWVVDSSELSTVRHRIIGTPRWIQLEDLKSPFTFTGLTACSQYEFQFAQQCQNEPLSFSESSILSTDGCCQAPALITPTEVAPNQINITWENILSATDYEIELSLSGANAWNTFNSTTADWSLLDLTPCTIYDVRVRPNCPSRSTAFSEIFQFTTKGCGVCTDVEYCASSSANGSLEWIESVRLNEIDNTSGSDGGFGDYSAVTTTLETFTSYEMEIIPGFSEGEFDEFYKVWIDYNQDGLFDNNSEVALESAAAIRTPFTSTFTIPEGANVGLTRMRIAMVADFESLARTPCATYNYGEVEDYCVTITDGNFQCIPPPIVQLQELTNTSAQFTWEVGNSSAQYRIRYRLAETNNWEEQSFAPAANYVLNNLSACSIYEYEVLTDCTNNTQSEWSATQTFSTLCQCTAPQNVQFTSLDNTGLTISWDELPSAELYSVFYASINGSNVTQILVEDNTLTIQDLPECVDLNIAITSSCLGELGGTTEFPVVNICTVNTEEINKQLEEVNIFPNPFIDQLSVELTFQEPTVLRISMLTMDGKVVHPPIERTIQQNQFSISIPLTNLPQGIYLLNIQTDFGSLTRRVVKME